MVALYLAPLYILLNVYLLRWMYLWIGSCHYLFQTMTASHYFCNYIFFCFNQPFIRISYKKTSIYPPTFEDYRKLFSWNLYVHTYGSSDG